MVVITGDLEIHGKDEGFEGFALGLSLAKREGHEPVEIGAVNKGEGREGWRKWEKRERKKGKREKEIVKMKRRKKKKKNLKVTD